MRAIGGKALNRCQILSGYRWSVLVAATRLGTSWDLHGGPVPVLRPMAAYLPEAQQTCSGERTMKRCLGRELIVGTLAIILIAGVMRRQSQADEPVEVRYLAFQVFTCGPDPRIPMSGEGMKPLGSLPDKAALRDYIEDIKRRIGTVGDQQTRLAVMLGQLCFDHRDAEITKFIELAFGLALETDVAVGFHIDDSMFWARRKDLWSDPNNVEAMDWDGTPCTGRRLDWGTEALGLRHRRCVSTARRSGGRCSSDPPFWARQSRPA